MTVFQELGGSPVEIYTPDGLTATRQFLVPWENRNEFVQNVFGNSGRLPYPGRSDVRAARLRFEPFDSDAVNICTLENPETDFVDYNGSFAKAVVEYATIGTAERNDGPVGEEGTSISYRMTLDSEYVDLSNSGWRWSDTLLTVPAEQKIEKATPYTLHHLTWSNVVNPPWNMIIQCQGTVNNAEFLGCAAGTLLFEGAEASKLYGRSSDGLEQTSNFAWSIKYTFRERSVKMGNGVYGWNYFYRDSTATWNMIQNGTKTVYTAKDFNALFNQLAIEI